MPSRCAGRAGAGRPVAAKDPCSLVATVAARAPGQCSPVGTPPAREVQVSAATGEGKLLPLRGECPPHV